MWRLILYRKEGAFHYPAIQGARYYLKLCSRGDWKDLPAAEGLIPS